MAPPEGLTELVDRFGRNLEDYRDPRYKETRLRRPGRRSPARTRRGDRMAAPCGE
jgi:hypothetical protein